jgi:hypothetical protein
MKTGERRADLKALQFARVPAASGKDDPETLIVFI